MKSGLKSKNGNVYWKVGEWKKHNEEISLCESGFHASKLAFDAIGLVDCEIIAQVEVRGKSIIDNKKEVWSEMCITKIYEWTKEDSVALAIFAAELIIKNFEDKYPDDKRPRFAIEAAKEYLKEKTVSAASAARAAYSASNVAYSAAAYAAYSAAHAAYSAANVAYSAAYSAAAHAADSAARAAYGAEKSAASAARAAYISCRMSDRAADIAAKLVKEKCEQFIMNRLSLKG